MDMLFWLGVFSILSALGLLPDSTEKEEEVRQTVAIDIQFTCPPCEKLQVFWDSIPSSDPSSVTVQEWRDSFVHSMDALVDLVKSESIDDASLSVSLDEASESEL